MEGIVTLLNFLFVALGVSLVAAWPGMYLLWARELRRKPILASPIQILRWITWLVLLTLVALGTIFVLGYIAAVVTSI